MSRQGYDEFRPGVFALRPGDRLDVVYVHGVMWVWRGTKWETAEVGHRPAWLQPAPVAPEEPKRTKGYPECFIY